MKLYIIAGEASGDLHGANLIKAFRAQDPSLSIRCWGGDLMKEAGGDLVKHFRDLAFMGFVEVLMNLKTILRNLDFCKQDIQQFQPDAIVLIDYPGFNMRMAEWAKQKGIPVYYYVPPQIWAWKKGRVHKIKRDVEKVFCVLPFEYDFYKKYDVNVEFVGHPLLDAIPSRHAEHTSFCAQYGLDQRPIIALLPGSRTQEISKMLPVMLSVQQRYPKYQFVIGGAPGQSESTYHSILGHSNIPVVFNATYDLMQVAKAGLVTSGTATLEAGIFKLPQVVCYKANPISYWIARMLIKIDFISLVNLIVDRLVVTELIQQDLNTNRIDKELRLLLEDQEHREELEYDYKELHEKLGGSGASEKTARAVLKSLSKA